MRFDPQRHRRRRSLRLEDYDYARTGAYFVTICARNWECLFGEVVQERMVLNEYGGIVHREWARSAEIRNEIELDEFVVMPNHLHGIVFIVRDGTNVKFGSVGATGRSPLQPRNTEPCGPRSKSLGSFIAGFKSAATRRINTWRGAPGVPVWQRNYYDHIIRNDDELHRIREYIMKNPHRWAMDAENPDRAGKRNEEDPA